MQTDNRGEIAHILTVDPAKLNELECMEIKDILLQAGQKIDAQLSAKKRTFANGDPMTPAQFRHWRTKAITAKNHIIFKYKQVIDQLKEIRRSGAKAT